MDKFKRNYQRRFIARNGITISYLYSEGTSKKLIAAFPPGFRNASHFVEHFDFLDNYWNIIVFDPLGRGESSSSANLDDYFTSFEIYLDIIETEGFKTSDTVIMGKSFSAPFVEYLLRQKDDFYYSIIITGPRLLSKIEYAFTVACINLAIRSWVVRDIFNLGIHYIARHTPMGFEYYNWKDVKGWLQWKMPLIIRNHPLTPQINTPTLLIYNKKDELIPLSKVKEAEIIFKNGEILYVNSYTHWGPITEELINLVNTRLKELE